jgi:signal peptidase II
MVAAAWARALGVTLLVIAADQASKAWVNATIARGERESVFVAVDFVNVRNRGVAFGLLASGRGLVLALTGLALVALVVYFATHPMRKGLWLPTGLLVGGALGNLIDRLRGEAVTDFIDLPLWPPFNLADASITVGVLVLLYVVESGAGRERAGKQGGEEEGLEPGVSREGELRDEGDPRPA